MKSLRKKLLSFSLSFALIFYFTFLPAGQFVFNNAQPKVAYAATSYNLPSATKDGVILHAFDWSFNSIKSQLADIAAAGYKSIQVSPVQGTKDSSTDPSKWWLLYQPTNQSVGNAQLGSYSDFKALCSEAQNYGISIIVDVVMNHMAGTGNNDEIDPAVDSAFKNSSYYHNQGQCSNWNSRYDITQKGIGMPDLNTQNSEVQNKAINFLNQCVDAGADGFRFDAAKHIETNVGLDANQSWSGNYWTNVLGNLHNRSNLYIYGEILQDGKVDNISSYASFMNVTASNYGYDLRNAVTSSNLNTGNGMGGLTPKDCVNFVETHDTYEDGTSKALTSWQRTMGWAIAAARSGATPLFFDRPTSTIGNPGETLWKDTNIVAVNKFHNAMVGLNEYLRWTNNNQTMLIDRGTKGTVIVNAAGSTYLNSPTSLESGTYTNHGSASCTLNVSNGTITGNIPGNSIIVLYKDTVPPVEKVTWSPTTATPGSTITITYNASGTALQGSSSVSAHWGYDGWKGTTDTIMTKTADNLWKVTLTVPTSAASQLNLCFTNGINWDSNNSLNWSIPVTTTITTYPRSGYTVDYDSSTLIKGGRFTIYYKGTLASSSKVLLHWGTNGWLNPTDVAMTKRADGFWQGTITIPTNATQLDFVFTNGTTWDNNNTKDWHLQVN